MGSTVSTPVRASARDLRALAAIVSEDRPDQPDGEGLPPSLLADLMGQIRCDVLTFFGMDSGQRAYWFGQDIPPIDTDWWEDLDLGAMEALLGLPALQLPRSQR